MASTIVEWQSPTTGEGSKWTVCTLIAHAEILKERNQNFLVWSYAQPLRQELLSPAVFSKLSIGMLSQMHTHAGIVLYEICTRYKNVGRTSRQHWRWWLPVLTGHPDTEKLAKIEYRFFKRDTSCSSGSHSDGGLSVQTRGAAIAVAAIMLHTGRYHHNLTISSAFKKVR